MPEKQINDWRPGCVTRGGGRDRYGKQNSFTYWMPENNTSSTNEPGCILGWLMSLFGDHQQTPPSESPHHNFFPSIPPTFASQSYDPRAVLGHCPGKRENSQGACRSFIRDNIGTCAKAVPGGAYICPFRDSQNAITPRVEITHQPEAGGYTYSSVIDSQGQHEFNLQHGAAVKRAVTDAQHEYRSAAIRKALDQKK